MRDVYFATFSVSSPPFIVAHMSLRCYKYVSGLFGIAEARDVKASKKIYQKPRGRGCISWGMVSIHFKLWIESTIYSNMEGGETPTLWSPLESDPQRPSRGCDHLGPQVCLQTLLPSSDLPHFLLSYCHKSSVVRWCVCTHDIQRHLVIDKEKLHLRNGHLQ